VCACVCVGVSLQEIGFGFVENEVLRRRDMYCGVKVLSFVDMRSFSSVCGVFCFRGFVCLVLFWSS
jgi:hypothetical protein